VVAIWSTLGLAGRLAERLRESNLLVVSFIFGFLLAIVAITWGGLQRRPRGREIWVVLGVATAYGMVVVRMGVPVEERTHLFEYGLVAVLVYRALRERMRSEQRVFSRRLSPWSSPQCWDGRTRAFSGSSPAGSTTPATSPSTLSPV
jgi:hypothetical protein